MMLLLTTNVHCCHLELYACSIHHAMKGGDLGLTTFMGAIEDIDKLN